MRFFRNLAAVITIIALACAAFAAGSELLKAGAKIDALPVGKVIYHNVTIRSVSVHSVMITHAGGMTSVRLHDLSPEWQTRFNYNPAAEQAAEEAARNSPPPPPVVHHAHVARKGLSPFDTLLQKFGQPATLLPEVDLRPQFFKLELGVKNQGARPSCAVFAIVSALEFQNAGLSGKVEKFSEEYLIWAVRKSVQRMPAPGTVASDDGGAKEFSDEGFSLAEVVSALRAYGIPLQSEMPNTFGSSIKSIGEPPPAIVQEARDHQRVFAHQLPGRDRATLLNNIVLTLNSGLPVAVGMAWPNARIINGYLSGQKARGDLGHAVTLVGYKSSTGRIEDAYFIFKNSWGPQWGQGGYGTVTYGYLRNYLDDAVLLEVQRS
ncbi:MAG TPA: C1 family peptidase [Lacunisphaera sp.]|jgi:hypothetical protein